MAKKTKGPEKDNSERWLLTYSDLMNLLLILFIILYCSSKIDAQKAQAVANSMHEGFGYTQSDESGGSGGSGGSGTSESSSVAEPGSSATPDSSAAPSSEASPAASPITDYDAYEAEIQKLIDEYGLEDKVKIETSDSKVVLSFLDNVLFEGGSAELNPDATALIDQMGDMLKNLQYSFILVEGYTDTDPIHNSQYQDNMDLSTQRAGNVWRELVKCGLSPDKMASIGYGEYRPIAPNDTPENKAKNRRVVVTIVRNDVDIDG